MVKYLNDMESLFRDARLEWFRFYTQHCYLSTDAGKSEHEALREKINTYHAAVEELTNNFSRDLVEFLEKNRNCADWRVARYSENSVTFGLVDAEGKIDFPYLSWRYRQRRTHAGDRSRESRAVFVRRGGTAVRPICVDGPTAVGRPPKIA